MIARSPPTPRTPNHTESFPHLPLSLHLRRELDSISLAISLSLLQTFTLSLSLSLSLPPSMASPATLPVSNNQSSAAAAAPAPISTPAFRAFLSRISGSLRSGLSQRRPWMELLDRSAFSRPESLTDAYSRIRKNLGYFRVNYASMIALVLALSLLSHPFSLLVLVSLLAAWAFLYLFKPSDQPLVLLGRTFSDTETLIGLVVLTVVVVFVSSVGSLLISALTVGFALVCAHGAFRAPEDLFLDEQEPANVGFLSFLGGAAGAAPSLAGRV